MLAPARERQRIVIHNPGQPFVGSQMRQAMTPDAGSVEIKSFERNDALAHKFAVNHKNNFLHEALRYVYSLRSSSIRGIYGKDRCFGLI